MRAVFKMRYRAGRGVYLLRQRLLSQSVLEPELPEPLSEAVFIKQQFFISFRLILLCTLFYGKMCYNLNIVSSIMC